MSISTAIYHTGLDPFTLEEVYVPKGREKRIQQALIHYRDPENYGLVREDSARREKDSSGTPGSVWSRRKRSSEPGGESSG